MKKIIAAGIALFIFIAGFIAPVNALSDSKSVAIQTLLDDACRISCVPGMSISIITEGETICFSSGYADREQGLVADENTLYELASVSKAFTGAGILLLEEQGLLSMTDSAQKYLPWLTFKYQGQAVDMQSLTLNHFLHHTSGLVNAKHIQNIPQGNTPDMLQKTVEVLVGEELAFSPGKEYNYGTVNYDVLGLVIEVVTAQSYESFMTEQIFKPLGLHNTYAYKEDAQATGKLAQGYRTSFFIAAPYDAPDFGGNKPAGYIISSAADMARWMGIQMGIVQDIPDVFQAVIKKSHQGNMSVPDVDGMYYAAGWMVDADETIVEHSGGNPNFATEVVIFPNEQTAICLLSNGANTNISLAFQVKEILDGNLSQSYAMSGTQILDATLSSVTIMACLLAAMFFVFGLRRKKNNKRQLLTQKRIFFVVAWMVVTVGMCIMCWVFPLLIGYDWTTVLIWQTYSIVTVLISLALLLASITWLVYSRRYSAAMQK